MTKLKEDIRPIVADMMINNPRTFVSCALVLSNVLKFVADDDDDDDEKLELLELLEQIKDKFEPIFGTGILNIWLQRISFPIIHIWSMGRYFVPSCQVCTQCLMSVFGTLSRLQTTTLKLLLCLRLLLIQMSLRNVIL